MSLASPRPCLPIVRGERRRRVVGHLRLGIAPADGRECVVLAERPEHDDVRCVRDTVRGFGSFVVLLWRSLEIRAGVVGVYGADEAGGAAEVLHLEADAEQLRQPAGVPGSATGRRRGATGRGRLPVRDRGGEGEGGPAAGGRGLRGRWLCRGRPHRVRCGGGWSARAGPRTTRP